MFRSLAEGLDERDRAFAMQLAYGTVQRVRTLDHAIEMLGRWPVRKLDPPVRAALRLGAYARLSESVPPHAAANESVELVRSAGLERAVPLANAVMRRLGEGIGSLLAGLTEETPAAAALNHSYPDWVAEVWWSELGADDALALMRAQNEPPERAVREPTGGLLAPWPQSRGSQLAGAAVGARSGEKVLDLCAAPGGKATQLVAAGAEVVAVEKHPGRARELEENAARLGAPLRGRQRGRTRAGRRADGFRPRAGGCAVLGPRRPQLAPRPALAGAPPSPAAAGPAPRRSRADTTRRVDHVLGLHDSPGGERGGRRRSRLRPRRPGRGVPRVPPPAPAEFLHAAACARHVRLLRRPPAAPVGSRRGLEDWVRTIEIEPSLYAADFSSWASRSTICSSAGARTFHFDIGDGHFVEPITIGPVVLQSIAPLIHKAGGVIDCHLMVDNPEHHFEQVRSAGGDSVTFHVEVTDEPWKHDQAARDLDLGVGVAFNPETRSRTPSRPRSAPTSSSA